MLRELHISGLGVIDDLDLEFDPGLNVLTGETGTGKTMVTVGLSLALGARASASMVRPGANAARVQARFDVGDATDGLDEWADDGEVLLARTVGADGKGSARLGRQLATAGALAEVGSALVEVHGQHQGQRLLSVVTQAAFLDRFAGERHLVTLGDYQEVFERLRVAIATLDELRAVSRDREREVDLLGYQVREIEAVAPRNDETIELTSEEARLAHVERLLDVSGAAEQALGGSDVAAGTLGAAETLGAATASLEDASTLDPEAGELSSRARSLVAELQELARDVRRYRESLNADPGRLQEVRERLVALRSLHRKYGETDAQVLTFLTAAAERLASLAGVDERLGSLESEMGTLRARAAEHGGRVSAGRGAAAPRLAAALREELHELGMPGAAVEVALESFPELAAAGAERVDIRLAAGPGQPALPLTRTASGGELSRTMLACRSVLADLDDVPTLVFDEVDAGIGGQAGLAVGRRLARLARGRQVVVVTHLPQIACFADRHVRVRKREGTASVEALDETARVRELSRMLAGLEESRSGVSHAQELLIEAGRIRAG